LIVWPAFGALGSGGYGLGALAALGAVLVLVVEDAAGVALPLAAGATLFAAGEAALDAGAVAFFARGVAFAAPSEQNTAATDARPKSERWSQRFRDDIRGVPSLECARRERPAVRERPGAAAVPRWSTRGRACFYCSPTMAARRPPSVGTPLFQL
jgi:hypothetical protein